MHEENKQYLKVASKKNSPRSFRKEIQDWAKAVYRKLCVEVCWTMGSGPQECVTPNACRQSEHWRG